MPVQDHLAHRCRCTKVNHDPGRIDEGGGPPRGEVAIHRELRAEAVVFITAGRCRLVESQVRASGRVGGDGGNRRDGVCGSVGVGDCDRKGTAVIAGHESRGGVAGRGGAGNGDTVTAPLVGKGAIACDADGEGRRRSRGDRLRGRFGDDLRNIGSVDLELKERIAVLRRSLGSVHADVASDDGGEGQGFDAALAVGLGVGRCPVLIVGRDLDLILHAVGRLPVKHDLIDGQGRAQVDLNPGGIDKGRRPARGEIAIHRVERAESVVFIATGGGGLVERQVGDAGDNCGVGDGHRRAGRGLRASAIADGHAEDAAVIRITERRRGVGRAGRTGNGDAVLKPLVGERTDTASHDRELRRGTGHDGLADGLRLDDRKDGAVDLELPQRISVLRGTLGSVHADVTAADGWEDQVFRAALAVGLGVGGSPVLAVGGDLNLVDDAEGALPAQHYLPDGLHGTEVELDPRGIDERRGPARGEIAIIRVGRRIGNVVLVAAGGGDCGQGKIRSRRSGAGSEAGDRGVGAVGVSVVATATGGCGSSASGACTRGSGRDRQHRRAAGHRATCICDRHGKDRAIVRRGSGRRNVDCLRRTRDGSPILKPLVGRRGEPGCSHGKCCCQPKRCGGGLRLRLDDRSLPSGGACVAQRLARVVGGYVPGGGAVEVDDRGFAGVIRIDGGGPGAPDAGEGAGGVIVATDAERFHLGWNAHMDACAIGRSVYSGKLRTGGGVGLNGAGPSETEEVVQDQRGVGGVDGVALGRATALRNVIDLELIDRIAVLRVTLGAIHTDIASLNCGEVEGFHAAGARIVGECDVPNGVG